VPKHHTSPNLTREEEVQACRTAFSFLIEVGFEQPHVEYHAPDSFRGGFILRYVREASELQIRYLECEAEVSLDSRELFGPHRHGSFAGNIFSSENFLRCICRIALDVRAASGL
jgi:hypothetical protein